MLPIRLESGFRFLGRFFRCHGLPGLPVCWNEEQLRIYMIPKRKWIPYYISMGFVAILWLTCVYTLTTQLWLHRKTFGILPACILTTGFGAFSMTMAVGSGLCESRIASKISAINQYLQLESELHSKYQPDLERSKGVDFLDIMIFLLECAVLVLYGILFACLYLDLDGPYWVIEDFAPSALYREPPAILFFLLVRTLLLIPGFWETGRSLLSSGMMLFAVLESMTVLVKILTYKVKSVKQFYRYYTHLSILCNTLEGSSTRVLFFTVTAGSLLWIQWIWICVKGFGKLELPIYSLFLVMAIIVGVAILVFLPRVAVMGEAIVALPKLKRVEIRRIYYGWKSKRHKIAWKKSLSIKPFRFQYGSFYPMGNNFSRNTFGNVIENAMTVILLFDIKKQ